MTFKSDWETAGRTWDTHNHLTGVRHVVMDSRAVVKPRYFHSAYSPVGYVHIATGRGLVRTYRTRAGERRLHVILIELMCGADLTWPQVPCEREVLGRSVCPKCARVEHDYLHPTWPPERAHRHARQTGRAV